MNEAELSDLTEEQLATDARIETRRLAFEFLLQQEYFGTAAMMVAEYIAHIQRLETAESSGNLSPQSVKSAAILWRNEIKGFKLWYSADGRDRQRVNNLTNKSDDELREIFEASSQTLASLVHSLGNRPDMQNAIAQLMCPDDMLETFAELAVKEPDLMRLTLQASVAALVNAQSMMAADEEIQRKAVKGN